MLPPQIFIHARDWSRLHSALLTTTGRGSPQKINLQKFKIWPKIERVRPYNFATNGCSLTKLLQTTCHEARVIICVQFLEGLPPKICEGQKRPNFGAISDNFRLSSRISPERIYISNIWKKIDQPQPLPRWKKETWWTLVHKQKSSRGAYWATQVDIFRETTFRPSWNFYTL